MKQYYTLVQAFNPEHRHLDQYLDVQGIDYKVGADFAEELKPFGFTDPHSKTGTLLKTYTVLIDEHELSAITLSVDGVFVIKNRSNIDFQNKVRSYFSWILD